MMKREGKKTRNKSEKREIKMRGKKYGYLMIP